MGDETIIRFLQGKLSAEEMKSLSDWINSSEENLKYFEDVRNIWLGTSSYSREQSFNANEKWKKTLQKFHETSVIDLYNDRHRAEDHIKKFIRFAALFLLIFSLGAVVSWYVFSNAGVLVSPNPITEIMCPLGSRSHIILPDGSRVWLNAGSKVTYDSEFNKSARIINLNGEAYFNVVSNKNKPFIVFTSHIEVKAYGTKFNVKAYPEDDEIVTTLVEGNVTIENKSNDPQKLIYTLKPDQSMTYFKSKNSLLTSNRAEKKSKKELKHTAPEDTEHKVKIEKEVNTKLYTSWKDEDWVIESVNLNDFAKMLERRYNTKILFKTDEIKKYKFSGTIRNETLEQVLDILKMTAPVKYEVGKGWVEWDLDPKSEKKYKGLLYQ